MTRITTSLTLPAFRYVGLFLAVAGILLCARSTNAQVAGPVPSDFVGSSSTSAGPDVDGFTGAFGFNLPLLTVPGPEGSSYTISMSYNSGASANQEVSWVGYGWTLNAGSIVRNTRGLPDDWKDTVIRWNRVKRNWTVSAITKHNFEIISKDQTKKKDGSDNTNDTNMGRLGVQSTLRYNSYTGFSHASGIGIYAKGVGGMSYAVDRGEGSFTPQLDLSVVLDPNSNNDPKENGRLTALPLRINLASVVNAGLISGLFSREIHYPLAASARYYGESVNYSASFLASIPSFGMGYEFGVEGNHTYTQSYDTDTIPAFGYMYSGLATSDPSAQMDYSIEKNNPYKKTDEALPIPFNNADSYYRFGIDVGGGFRLYNRSAGVFRPNHVSNRFSIVQAGLDIVGGGRWGIGGHLGIGSHSHEEGAWNGLQSEFSFSTNGDEPYFFRMGGDLGGQSSFGPHAHAVQATFAYDTINGLTPWVTPEIRSRINNGTRSGRSTYIGFNTNEEMEAKTEFEVRYRAYNKDAESLSHVNRTRDKVKSSIGEIAIDNASGYRYIYGLPLYARKEKKLTLGLPFIATDQPWKIKYNYLAHDTITEDSVAHVQGEERAAPYVAAHLLTAITTPDYIDRTNNGPTVDDFGGYTRFTYDRPFDSRQKDNSSSSSWFSWRAPYTGFSFNRGELSDPSDDAGSYSTGEREVYRLQTVETKTHMAVFVTNTTNVVLGTRTIRGSMVDRGDAYSPYLSYSGLSDHVRAAGDSSFTGAVRHTVGLYNRQAKLERIELYTRDAQGRPDSLLQTVHLGHDYSLRPNMPNSLTVAVDSVNRLGMLTLKKVWVQNQNVVHSRINPYEFGYEYRKSNDYPSAVRSKYSEIAGFADSLSAAEQNPAYSPYDFDSWGNYQYQGASRLSRMQPWVSQVPNPDSFDPAAWQLKWIRTPSQSEIQVQYEQNDYAFVQDQQAMGMVSLRRSFGTTGTSSDSESDNRYYLNLADLGIDTTSYGDVARLRARIASQYLGKARKIYFRFLYALLGDTAHLYQSDYNSEYISGYASVADIGIETVNDGITIYHGIYLTLRESGSEDIEVPKQVCLDFVEKRKQGKLSRTEPIRYHPGNAPAMIVDLLSIKGSPSVVFNPVNHCKAIDYSNSYIRVPLTRPKKGGGVRVKRLLSLNAGTEGDSTLHGTEFLYDADDDQAHERTSSGVAINEPAAAREENALVDLLRSVNSIPETRNKVIAGADLNRFEGPRGESLLPGASVGYSRVISRNIHSGKTAPGFAISEYFTARDYPFNSLDTTLGRGAAWTPVIDIPRQVLPYWSPITYVRVNIDNIWLTQGYRFVLNDMHGKPRTSSTYGGNYADSESWFLSGSSTVNYYKPGEAVPVVGQIGDSVVLENLGQTIDVVMESRATTDITIDGMLEGDATVFPPAPQYTGQAYLNANENKLRSHVTTKVSHFPALTKSVETYADGQYSVSRTLAFDRQTGNPLISTSSDGYDRLGLDTATSAHNGQYHAVGVPAHSQFERMGQKAINERAIIYSSTAASGFHVLKRINDGSHSLVFSSTDSSGKNEMARIGPGDLIELTLASDLTTRQGLYHVGARNGNTVQLLLLSTTFAVPSISFDTVNVEVIRSGRTNQLNASIGGIATYGLTDQAVQTGAYVTRIEPAGFADRLAFRDALRTRLSAKSGTVLPSNLPSGLQFVSSDDICASLEDSIRVDSLSGGRLQISTPRGYDTLYRLGAGDHLELEDDGTLSYYASVDAHVPQRFAKITFCPEKSFVRHEIDGVLSAGASMLDDSIVYTPSEFGGSPINPNSYETGMRGKWRGRSSYGYRTSVTPGSRYGAHQRVYRNAGVYDDFTLFNWQNPEANDSMKWVRGDTVIRFSPHGVPLETRSPLGIYSALKTGYDNHLPNYAAVNARYTAIGFQDFETLVSADPDVVVVQGIAHTGNRSLRLTSDVVHAPVIPTIIADPQIIANGVLINFWARFSRYGLDTTNCLSLTSTPWGSVLMTAEHRIAQSGEWTLYQVMLTTPAPADSTPLVFGIHATIVDSTDTIWVDDIRVQPADAEMICHVYDTQTLRPMASLDADHFAAFNQYNAEGRVVRTIVETARGVRTVAETHANLPGVSRVPSPPGDTLPLLETTILVSRNPGRAFLADLDERIDHRSSSELASLTFDGLGSPDIKVLGADLAALEKAFTGNKLVLAERWLRIRNEYDSLSSALRESPDDPALQAEAEARIREIDKQQDRILRQLGISRKEMEALLEPQTSASE